MEAEEKKKLAIEALKKSIKSKKIVVSLVAAAIDKAWDAVFDDLNAITDSPFEYLDELIAFLDSETNGNAIDSSSGTTFLATLEEYVGIMKDGIEYLENILKKAESEN